jgi:hypothetical protein
VQWKAGLAAFGADRDAPDPTEVERAENEEVPDMLRTLVHRTDNDPL